MSVKIVYEDLAVGADEAATVSSADAQALSNLSRLPFGLSAGKVATGEQGGWILSGLYALPDSQRAAFWSTAMSNAAGAFSTPPTITIDLDSVFTSLGIALTFDEPTNDWCSEIELLWYRDSTLLHDETFYPDGVIYFCEATIANYNRLVIKIKATKLPYRYAKLTKIMFGIERVFDRSELRHVHVIQEVNLISDEVAINTMDFTLNPSSGLQYVFQTRQPLLAYDDDALIGVFYIKDARQTTTKQQAKSIYDINAQDAVGVLDEETISAKMYDNDPLQDVLEEIVGTHFELDIDSALSTATVSGYIPETTRRQALHLVAFRVMAIVDTSSTDKIRIFPMPVSAPAVVPQDRIYMGGRISTETPLTAVRLTSHSYSQTGSGTDTVVVDGVTYYHTTGVTEITNPYVSVLEKRRVIEITDATTITPDVVNAVAQYIFDYYVRYNTYSQRIVLSREKPGDLITAYVPWGDAFSGNITRMDITLSGIAAADIEVIGT